MGESLMYSWLRHIKQCQITQLNWKVSDKWNLTVTNSLEKLMVEIQKKFDSPFGQIDNLQQLFKQSEVDVIGFNFNSNTVYGVDVAFHTYGLRYKDNVKNITKKMFRTLLTLDAYFDNTYKKEVIFTTPKINPNEYNLVVERIKEINKFLEEMELDTTITFISNKDFGEQILYPILSLSDEVADTSELFLRSYQLTKLFSNPNMKNEKNLLNDKQHINKNPNEIPIGKLVKNTFNQLFKENKLNDSEIKNLMDIDYSRNVFAVKYPILKLIDLHINIDIQRKVNDYDRYYAKPFSNKYLLCNDWYSTNRTYFEKWLSKIK